MADPIENINPWTPVEGVGKEWETNPWTILTTPLEIGSRVWNNFRTVYLAKTETQYIKDASDNWGVTAQRWRLKLLAAYKPYIPIYGYIYLAAQKRKMRPEFIHAVVFGEGLNDFIDFNVDVNFPADLNTSINGYNYLGLDQITARIPVLVSGGYLEKKYQDKYWVPEHLKGVKNELGGDTASALIIGFEAAVEMVAAELQERGDYMQRIATNNGVVISTQEQKEFLMYGKYVSKHYAEDDLISTEALQKNASKWDIAVDGVWPENPSDSKFYRYQSLIRLATAEWYTKASIYSA